MVELIEKGGVLIYPIIFCSVLVLTFGIERAYYFLKVKEKEDLLNTIKTFVKNREFDKALKLAEDSKTPVTSMFREIIKNKDKTKAEIEEIVSLNGTIELKKLNKNLHIVELIGNIAPLLGLLGTVLGMVKAFKSVEGLKGAIDPSYLAGGIWESLLTTVAGLFVAIPAIVIHHFFEDRIKNIAFDMKHKATEIINIIEVNR